MVETDLTSSLWKKRIEVSGRQIIKPLLLCKGTMPDFNTDALFKPDTVAMLFCLMEEHPEAGMACGQPPGTVWKDMPSCCSDYLEDPPFPLEDQAASGGLKH